jgi:hypothetical protein
MYKYSSRGCFQLRAKTRNVFIHQKKMLEMLSTQDVVQHECYVHSSRAPINIEFTPRGVYFKRGISSWGAIPIIVRESLICYTIAP